jgi:hypothetical protein
MCLRAAARESSRAAADLLYRSVAETPDDPDAGLPRVFDLVPWRNAWMNSISVARLGSAGVAHDGPGPLNGAGPSLWVSCRWCR